MPRTLQNRLALIFMPRTAQNRRTLIVHECPICGRKEQIEKITANQASKLLVENGWSFTSQLDGGRWHLVCPLHRKASEPQTLYIDKTQPEEACVKYKPQFHGRADR
jgi:hypothetical protein